MHSVALMLRRSMAQRGVFAAIGASVLVVTGLTIGLIASLSAATTQGARVAVSSATAADSVFRFTSEAAVSSSDQLVAAQTVFDRELRNLPATVHHHFTTKPLTATIAGQPVSGSNQITLLAENDFSEVAKLTSGDWVGNDLVSNATVPGVLNDAAADALGIAVDDVIQVGSGQAARDIQVVGTWLPINPKDPIWFDRPGASSGKALLADGSTVFGPLVVPVQEVFAFGVDGWVQWTLVPDAAALVPSDLDSLVSAAGTVQSELSETSEQYVKVTGGLNLTAQKFHRMSAAINAITPVGVGLIGIIGAITVLQLASLLTSSRRQETALLKSRGAAGVLVVWDSAEAALVCGSGAVLGLAAASLVASGAGGIRPLQWNWVAAAALAVAAALLVLISSLRDSRAGSRVLTPSAGRASAPVAMLTAGVLIVVAGVAVGQSLLYGSPRITDAAGNQSVDVLVVLAPALALIALSVALLAALGPLARIAAAVAARRARFQPVYSLRQLARRLPAYSAGILVISLGLGSLTIASAYAATWSSLRSTVAELQTGSDLRVQWPGHSGAITAAPFSTIDGVSATAPSIVSGATIGANRTKGVMRAVPATGIRSVMSNAGGVDTRGLANLLQPAQRSGVVIPIDTESLNYELQVVARAPDTGVTVTDTAKVQSTLWLEDSDGSIVPVKSEEIAAPTGATAKTEVTVQAPEGVGPWRIVAIDISAQAGRYWSCTALISNVSTVAKNQELIPLEIGTQSWSGQLLLSDFGNAKLDHTDDALATTLQLNKVANGSVRLMPPSVTAPLADKVPFAGTTNALPVVISSPLADELHLVKGDTVPIQLTGEVGEVNGEIVSVTPLVPGSTNSLAVLSDLSSLNQYLLRTSAAFPRVNEMLLRTDAPGVNVNHVAGATAIVHRASDVTDLGLGRATADFLWQAAVGCLVLALIAFTAVLAAASRARAIEVVVLKALGILPKRQATGTLLEAASVAGVAIMIGVAGGALTSYLTVPSLARSVVLDVPHGVNATLDIGIMPATMWFGVVLVALLLVSAIAAIITFRRASASGARFEVS